MCTQSNNLNNLITCIIHAHELCVHFSLERHCNYMHITCRPIIHISSVLVLVFDFNFGFNFLSAYEKKSRQQMHGKEKFCVWKKKKQIRLAT